MHDRLFTFFVFMFCSHVYLRSAHINEMQFKQGSDLNRVSAAMKEEWRILLFCDLRFLEKFFMIFG